MFLDRLPQDAREKMANACQDMIQAKPYDRLSAETAAMLAIQRRTPYDAHHGIESCSSEDGKAVIIWCNTGDAYSPTVCCVLYEDDPLFFWHPRFFASTMGDELERLEAVGFTFA